MQREQLVYDGYQDCPYLDGRTACMPLYRQLQMLDGAEADRRFAGAERRVGASLYRTRCPGCTACHGIRVPVAGFRPSKSQRRVARRWAADFRLELGPPEYSDERLHLFNKHKRERGLQLDAEAEMSAESYVGWLVHSCIPNVEMRYYLKDRLIGVGIVDLGERSASSVYFFFDPDPEVSRLSPGVFSVLQEIELCRRTGRDWLYLGLYVEDCERLNYKADYRPCQILVDGSWQEPGVSPRGRGG